MTDPGEAAALGLLVDQLGAVDASLIKAKCPRCRRWCWRQRHALTRPCYLCTPVDGYGTLFDLLLAGEFGLSAKAYHERLETYGPPWINSKAWIQPRSRWPKLGRPADDERGVVHIVQSDEETSEM